jgi:branched-chain amino acid transport system permease protein
VNVAWRSVLLGTGAFVVIASLPLWANQGLVFLAGLTLIEAVFALSWNLLFGYTGLASFGHAAFFAIGAYLTGAFLRHAVGVPFLALLLLSGAAGAFVAWLVGLVALRRTSGIQLAILTLALSEILRIFIGYSDRLGRDDGLAGIPRPSIDLGLVTVDLQTGPAYFWFLLIACSLLTALLWWVVHGRFGRVLRSIQQDADRAAFIGIPVERYRLASFTLSAGIAAIAGALAAPWSGIVTLDAAHWLHSTQPILNTLLGGAGSFWGPIVGALGFTVINYGTRTLIGLSEIVIGIVLLLVILVAPAGLLGLLQRRRTARPATAGEAASTAGPRSGDAA